MQINNKRIAIIDHTESLDGRVDSLKDFFESNGAKVKVITSDFSHYKKRKIIDHKNNYVYIHTIPYKRNISFKRIISHVYLAKKIKKYIDEEQWDLIWVLTPPNVLLYEITKSKKYKVIGDIEDLWPESLPIPKAFLKLAPVKKWQDLRNQGIAKSDFIVTECDYYKNFVNPYASPNKLTTLHLAMPVAKKIKDFKLDNNILKVAYLGSINNIIDIDNIVKTLKRLDKITNVEFNIIGDGESKDILIDRVEKETKSKVIYHGKIFDEKKKMKILKKCNLGINLMKDSVVVGLTMKSIDYFRYGLPIINNIKGDTSNLVEHEKIGLNLPFTESQLEQVVKLSYDVNYKNKVIDYYNSNFSIPIFNQRLNQIITQL